MRSYSNEWEKFTSDPNILQAVTGYKLEFIHNIPPTQLFVPFPYRLSLEEIAAVDNEIPKLLEKKVIEPSDHEYGEYISNVFTRPKKDGGLRMILDLSKLNEHIEYHHFKMDTFNAALSLISKNCYMASIDLKDAYYTVPIAEEHRKYLKFYWK